MQDEEYLYESLLPCMDRHAAELVNHTLLDSPEGDLFQRAIAERLHDKMYASMREVSLKCNHSSILHAVFSLFFRNMLFLLNPIRPNPPKSV